MGLHFFGDDKNCMLLFEKLQKLHNDKRIASAPVKQQMLQPVNPKTCGYEKSA